MKSKKTVFVDKFTNGILGPNVEFAGTVMNGGYIVAHTAPGCWGPMITPQLRGGHEVTRPVLVENAEVGDAIVIKVLSVSVASEVTTSGTDCAKEGYYIGDPFVADVCPNCGTDYPASYAEGIGEDAVKCKKCGKPVSAFNMPNGYTIAFDAARKFALTLNKEGAEVAARNASGLMAIPDNSVQHPIALFAKHDIVGLPARLRPFIGQLGTTPPLEFPDSHNAGDFGQALLGAPHGYAKTEDELEQRTDGHLDVNRVRQGCMVICPVKIPGGGVYVGDVHALQGDGEVAGHTCDVAAEVVLKVDDIKRLNLKGPLLLPLYEDLPYLARPFTEKEMQHIKEISCAWGNVPVESALPLAFIGSGATINAAADNAFTRASELLELSYDEIRNRCTINGAVQIGRFPGTATVTILVPESILEKKGILKYAREMYCV